MIACLGAASAEETSSFVEDMRYSGHPMLTFAQLWTGLSKPVRQRAWLVELIGTDQLQLAETGVDTCPWKVTFGTRVEKETTLKASGRAVLAINRTNSLLAKSEGLSILATRMPAEAGAASTSWILRKLVERRPNFAVRARSLSMSSSFLFVKVAGLIVREEEGTAISRKPWNGAVKSMGWVMSGFQTGLGVLAAGWILTSRSPATAEPFVPSTWIVRRSSRFTRVHQLLLNWAMIPLLSSKIA